MDRSRRRRIRIADALATAAIAALLTYLLLPTFQMARPSARKAICESNLRAIVRGLRQYEADRGVMPGYLVPVDDPGDLSQLAAAMEYPRQVLAPYVDASAWECPGASRRARRLGVSYVYPGFGGNGWQKPQVYGLENVPAVWDHSARHFGSVQVAYLDGHVEPHDPRSVIAVPAKEKWFVTELEVGEGDVLRIAAGGQVFSGPNAGPASLLPPSGDHHTAPDDAIAPTWPNGSLIGSVSGSEFFIGYAGELRAGATGPLLLSLNDSDWDDEFGDNVGSMWVLVAKSDAPPLPDVIPASEPFADLSGWSLTHVPPGRVTIRDGVLRILHEPGSGVHLRQRDPLPPRELDITLRVMVRTSEKWGPEYGLEGGMLVFGVGEAQASPGQRLPDTGQTFLARVSFRDQTRVRERPMICFDSEGTTAEVPLEWNLPWEEWVTVRIEVRRTWIRVVANESIIGSAPFDGRPVAPRHIWLSCASADVLIDRLEVTPPVEAVD